MKRIVVLGAGKSGTWAAVLAKQKGHWVFVSDKGEISDESKTVLSNNGIEWEEKKHSESIILSADEVIKSPGISEKNESIIQVRKKGIPVVAEIEFAGRYCNGKIIGITGSAGKTTTTLLTYYILKNAGLDVALAGNIGTVDFMGEKIGSSLAEAVAKKPHEYYVVELSSFQLDDMHSFRVNIAILTNITRNHLDRYEYDMEKYTASKFRITQNQTDSDYFIYNDDDAGTKNGLKNIKGNAKLIPFSTQKKLEKGAFLSDNQLIINLNKNPLTMSIYELALQGKHNIYNSMAAGITARVLDLRKEVIRESLSDFQNIEHRMEFVAKISDIEFINDSKATNVNSAWFALESMSKPVVWIVGGVDKGNDYSELYDVVKQKVKAIVCLGVDNKKIHEAFSGKVDTIVDARSAGEAVALGHRLASKGDVVLLSPACASFDLFKDYEERGRKFKDAVRAL